MILEVMKGTEGFPEFHDFGSFEDTNYMIMQMLGPNLHELFGFCKFKFSLRTILLIAIQLLRIVRELHAHSFIHRDIKPENFVIGLEEKTNQIYMIDFGLSKKYKDINTLEHIQYRENRQLVGTARYASVNSHLGIEQSRRDDLESIGYLLCYFFEGKLPWQGFKESDRNTRHRLIMEKKLTTPVEVLCKKLPSKNIKR